MIELRGLTKRYGPVAAVDDLTCTVAPGVVTGFLGPNGAGKTTTMRMVLGLDHPTAGDATVLGRRFAALPAPMRQVGALLDPRAVHPNRTARGHLRALAYSNGISRRRVDEVLGLVGLENVAGRRAGSFSLGMSQRLGIAAALLGEPAVLLFDEPVNGLDPEGIRWIRDLLRRLAASGRTVLVSSHLLSEMALTADQLIVVGRGRLIADTTTEDFLRRYGNPTVRVRLAEPAGSGFRRRLAQAAEQVVAEADDTWIVSGLDSAEVGAIAAADQVTLAELTPRYSSLEEVFMRLTSDSVEFRVDQPAGPAAVAAGEVTR
ncbi:ABC transporter ATP-binding protein [Natronosporangium hydrolyticum]|uniref:ABC transporter ATP-binding protein n=1 Tax=Natronosporangium hydrolyticum TaxID=2811111 RepID=A0A895YGG3_9ACTN|nr:ABC transporter ATP-binding protein [Natronosporangium hydrolyticum]QSB12778.1 ABC transporter ATP-binding protein [Natronosporangium hydrolyticum]